ncbi:hypothetical protein [Virgibacillus ihumii]|uniref:hypothetical protein n=1 Tax=Virgibacillus ihumii TaxID=2686091 RepID=UPI00157DB50C|nr:hypothetical protein [Virgibacillus ihumii]
MAKRNQKFGMGWFGWAVIGVIVLTVAASSLFFFNLFGFSNALFDGQASGSDEPISEETRQKVKKINETVGKSHQEIGTFVSKTHDFYNDTTGYGDIASLDWDQQQKRAEQILASLKNLLPEVNQKALKSDLKHIRGLANEIKSHEDTEKVRYLHRMFHDLDIALNNYKAYDKIWNVTETLETSN